MMVCPLTCPPKLLDLQKGTLLMWTEMLNGGEEGLGEAGGIRWCKCSCNWFYSQAKLNCRNLEIVQFLEAARLDWLDQVRKNKVIGGQIPEAGREGEAFRQMSRGTKKQAWMHAKTREVRAVSQTGKMKMTDKQRQTGRQTGKEKSKQCAPDR
jgi:hypothetical protein